MKTPSKLNISSLEIEIENKIATAYLFQIAARSNQLNADRLWKEAYTPTQEPTLEINQPIKNKANQHGNTTENPVSQTGA